LAYLGRRARRPANVRGVDVRRQPENGHAHRPHYGNAEAPAGRPGTSRPEPPRAGSPLRPARAAREVRILNPSKENVICPSSPSTPFACPLRTWVIAAWSRIKHCGSETATLCDGWSFLRRGTSA